MVELIRLFVLQSCKRTNKPKHGKARVQRNGHIFDLSFR